MLGVQTIDNFNKQLLLKSGIHSGKILLLDMLVNSWLFLAMVFITRILLVVNQEIIVFWAIE